MKNNYHMVDTCKTCLHHKEIISYDYFILLCNLDKSYIKYKSIDKMSDEEILKRAEWESAHEVKQYCTCDDFE